MTGFTNPEARKFYAEIYDAVMQDWEGELDFYQDLAAKYVRPDQAVLEIACGTGRISLRLAKEGHRVIGLDSSPDMIDIVSAKSKGLDHTDWVEGDMRDFQLDERFPLIILPAHSFQNLELVADHVSTLETIYDHMLPNGRCVIHVDHLDFKWLSELVREGEKTYQGESFMHPVLGLEVKTSFSWSYDPFTQTAYSDKIWEIVGADGNISEIVKSGRLGFHCFFSTEMEHLLGRCGFEIEHLFGDFSQGGHLPESTEMIWVVKKPSD